MTGCRCTVVAHSHHLDRPCENIGTEPNGLCPECHTLAQKKEPASLLTAMADLRRTWDDLSGLEADIVAAARPFTKVKLALFERCILAHQTAVAELARVVKR